MKTRTMRFLLTAAVLAPLVVARGTYAADDAASVLTKLHHSNQKEVKMGQEAKEKGQSQAVKDYGATLERDHTAADEKVAALARKKNVELTDPPKTEPKHELAPGASFDAQFAKMMIDDHKKDIAEVKAAHDKTSDAELKSLLGDLLPTLEKHLQTAESIAKGGGSPAANAH